MIVNIMKPASLNMDKVFCCFCKYFDNNSWHSMCGLILTTIVPDTPIYPASVNKYSPNPYDQNANNDCKYYQRKETSDETSDS